MNSTEIKELMKSSYAFRAGSIFIPEYTHGDLRIDALVVDTRRRWIRGFEIKTSRSDFLQDDKWMLYSDFCSSLSIICPSEIINPEEVQRPFGLMWIVPTMRRENVGYPDSREVATGGHHLVWKKKPTRRFQRRNSLAWLWTYTNVLEKEILRLDREAESLRQGMKRRAG
jgi:hypothetical protein